MAKSRTSKAGLGSAKEEWNLLASVKKAPHAANVLLLRPQIAGCQALGWRMPCSSSKTKGSVQTCRRKTGLIMDPPPLADTVVLVRQVLLEPLINQLYKGRSKSPKDAVKTKWSSKHFVLFPRYFYFELLKVNRNSLCHFY